MALASKRKLVFGGLAFFVFWLLTLFPNFPLLPIGRAAGSVLGASLMVVSQLQSPKTAYASVDLSILGLLFGTMLVSAFLERADLFAYLRRLLSWRSLGAKDLLCRLSLTVALSSALFTNDTCCVVFTDFILKLCTQNNLPPQPFLMALATSSNIGSAATPIGNPQNLVIAVQSGIPFGKFLLGILPAMVVGIVTNTALLLAFYWRQLSGMAVEDIEAKDARFLDSNTLQLAVTKRNSDLVEHRKDDWPSSPRIPVAKTSQKLQSNVHLDSEELISVSSPPECLQGCKSLKSSSSLRVEMCEEMSDLEPGQRVAATQEREGSGFDAKSPSLQSSPSKLFRCKYPSLLGEAEIIFQKRKRTIWKVCVYIVTACMLAALLYGLDLSWSALTAAAVLMVLDFGDATPSLDKVSYALLVFFSGMFITIDGFNKTGIPGEFWDVVEPHARIDSAGGIAVLALVVLLLSNFASNVPTVLLLGTRVAQSAALLHRGSITKGWLILAWTSTVAGNLTLIGSAANLIVSEQARKSPDSYHLSFWQHLWFGFPATLIVTAVGLPLIPS